MKRVVEIDAGQDGEDEGLQEGHEEFECGQRHGHGQRCNCSNDTAEAERAIALLQERRTALISAAVTGKIDVREVSSE